MVDTAVAATNMAFTNDVSSSGDFSGTATGGVSVAAAAYAVVTAPAGDTGDLVFTFYSSSGATATFVGGDEPPSENSGLSDSSAITLTAAKPYFIRVRAGRFVQNDGTIRVLIGTNTTIVGCYRQPKGA